MAAHPRQAAMEKSVHTAEYDALRDLLRAAREKAGLTQAVLADRLRESQSFVSKVERGERRLDLVQLRQFCQAIGVGLMPFVAAFEGRLSEKRRRERRV